MADLAVIILCRNEAIHLARALDCIVGIAKQIFVIDSFSTDDTVEIARSYGATILENRFVNYAVQFQWALENAPIEAGWVMRLDADEIVEPDLAQELENTLATVPKDIVGINLQRKHIFMGRWIRHGGRYPLILLRVWRRGHGRIEQRWMDEHMIVQGGRTITLRGGFADHNLNDLTFFTDKHNKYATREAIDVLGKKYSLFEVNDNLAVAGTSVQASLKRFIKSRFYNKLPLFAGPVAYFSYRYFLQFGFLDGREGLIYHMLQGFWYRFLVAAKVEEYDRLVGPACDRESKLTVLSKLTGHNLQ